MKPNNNVICRKRKERKERKETEQTCIIIISSICINIMLFRWTDGLAALLSRQGRSHIRQWAFWKSFRVAPSIPVRIPLPVRHLVRTKNRTP